MKKVALFIFLLTSAFSLCQESKYLDSILTLENQVSKEKFLELILQIEYDKALTNSKKYLELSKKATAIAIENGDKKSIAKSYRAQSLAYHFSSKYDLAVENTIKAAKIFNEINDIENFGFSYIELGWKLKYQDLEKGMFYLKKGISILEGFNKKSHHLIEGYNNYGVLKNLNKEKDSALYYHNKSLNLAKAREDKIGIPFAQTNIATIYMQQKKFLLAEKYLDSAMQLRQERNDIYGITDSYLYLGDLFFEKKEFRKAIPNFENALNLSKKNNYFPLKRYATQLLQKSYDSLNNYKKSLFYYKEFVKIKDSVNNVSTNNKIAELEIEYETAQKETKITEQELAIKNRNLYAILLAAALLILAIVSFAIYKKNQFKRKQLKKEIELKDALAIVKTQNRLQEQRLRISRDLHDNIGSQLTFIISSLDNLKFISKDVNEALKNKITSISGFTSETIHQLRDTIWAMNKSEITLEDLYTRILSFIEKAKLATNGIEFVVNQKIDKEISFSSLKGMHIFRVIQEAINNSIKYADASKITIIIDENENKINLLVTDNGKGFDIKTTELGNGLSNMETRMSEIDGKVFINSNENGTEIKIIL